MNCNLNIYTLSLLQKDIEIFKHTLKYHNTQIFDLQYFISQIKPTFVACSALVYFKNGIKRRIRPLLSNEYLSLLGFCINQFISHLQIQKIYICYCQ